LLLENKIVFGNDFVFVRALLLEKYAVFVKVGDFENGLLLGNALLSEKVLLLGKDFVFANVLDFEKGGVAVLGFTALE
jgi:hypothetical protein